MIFLAPASMEADMTADPSGLQNPKGLRSHAPMKPTACCWGTCYCEMNLLINLMYQLLVKLNRDHVEIFEFLIFFNDIWCRLFLRRLYRGDPFLPAGTLASKAGPVSVRACTEDDAEEISALLRQLEGKVLLPHRSDVASLRRVFRRPSYFSYRVEGSGQFMGYVLIRVFAPARAVFAIWLKPDQRGGGVGKVIAPTMVENIKKQRLTPYVTVTKDNEASLRMCLHAGYKIVRELPTFYVMKG